MNTQHHALSEVSWRGQLRAAFGLTLIALGLCGFVYSAAATGLGQLLFPEQANGSLIIENNEVLGSRLVAQPFQQVQYFHPRPSAANYDPMAMAGTNLARTNPELQSSIEERLNQISILEQVDQSQIPADLVTASGSGIDPDISVQAAMIQAKRIATARQMTEQEVIKLIEMHRIQPSFGILGQPRVNVLELNLALDQIRN